jgi:thiol-disulfide isomerase/thioredoxin
MNTLRTSTSILFLLVFTFTTRAVNKPLIEGRWKGILALSTTANLPFDVQIKRQKFKTRLEFHIINGKEDITLVQSENIKDSIKLVFPAFSTYLLLKPLKNNRLEGYWINPNKVKNNRIPCVITYGSGKRFEHPTLYLSTIQTPDIQGKWETTFKPGMPDSTKLLGIFQQRFNEVSGTFLSETGDYRFLEGNIILDSIFLSTFDGSHAFLFKGKISENKYISGEFYSGKHSVCKWIALKNNAFELPHPDSLTYLTTKEPFSLQIKNDNGVIFEYPNHKTENNVVIIQIMGTWCPNCMDESMFFKELYQKYHSKGLEIYALCYENGSDETIQKQRIKNYIEHLNPGYELILAGTSKKDLAAEHFKMLNHIISFPTAIFIGRDGSVKRIHTGFNGPGTDSYYTDYVQETESFILSLLQN